MTRSFSAELDHYCARILAREPMAMYRFGDGERMLMLGMPVGEHTQAARVDRWTAPGGLSKLGQDLRTVIESGQGAHAHFGISCPCCDPVSFQYYDERITTSPTFTANLFINANYGRWLEFLRKLANVPVAVIANEAADMATYAFDPCCLMPVPDQCVAHYETGREAIVARARTLAREHDHTVVLVAAGPLSEPLIHFMWNANPSNTYVDVGSSLDEFTYGRKTRPYMDHLSEYARKVCTMPARMVPPGTWRLTPADRAYPLDDVHVSRFIRKTDAAVSQVIVPLPAPWWSRPYEYAWAQSFAGKGDVVLDAACGVSHPLKFWLASVCRRTHACDLDARVASDRDLMVEIGADLGAAAAATIAELDLLPLVIRSVADLRDLPYAAQTFDRVFCISTLEHMDDTARVDALQQMCRVLKPGGLAVVTMDVPPDVGDLVAASVGVGFELAGALDTDVPHDAIYSAHYGLRVFRLLLRRPT